MSRLLLEGGTLLGLADREDIRPATDLYAENGTIARDRRRRRARLAGAAGGAGRAARRAGGKWVLPGFVQAHLHLCQTLLRNGPEDLELLPWLDVPRVAGRGGARSRRRWRSRRAWASSECLASGVTAVLDMGTVRHSDALFRAAARAGVRYTGGNVLMDDPRDDARGAARAAADEGLAETERLHADWHGRERGRLRVAVQPRFAVTCTDELLRARGGATPRTKGLLIHTHASENRRGVRPRPRAHGPGQHRLPRRGRAS